MSLGAAAGLFWLDFVHLLGPVLSRLLPAWAVTFLALVYGFGWLKKHLRPAVMRLDERVRYWAAGLRYRERQEMAGERTAWTWFFRFWTNFASSPSLTVWSFLVPILVYWWNPFGHDTGSGQMQGLHTLFLLPGWAFGGSMLLSFVSKRVFKRLRPERKAGAFGHKLKDGSFPSGHSLTSFVFWSMLAVAVAASGSAAGVVLGFWLTAATVVLFTGMSRIYLAVHFPSDVLGGYIIGCVWSVVCYFVLLPVL